MVDTDEAFDALIGDDAALRPGVEALLRANGVDPAGLTRYQDGSLPVYAAGELVLKLFPQVCAEDYLVEAGVLGAVEGRLPIATPAVHAAGEHGGWGYVIMGRLPGVSLATTWEHTTVADRDRIAGQLGETMATLHAVPPPGIVGWQPADWPGFVAEQRAGCVAHQRSRGLTADWLDQLPGYLDEVDAAGGLADTEPVLLHTEIMRQHLLVTEHPSGGWRLSGLFDFEPAMRGAREYEFAAVGVFGSEGDARFLRGCLTGYGYRADQLDHALSRRLLAWTLLHRYSNLPGYLRRLPAPERPTMDALADRWFGC